MSSGKKQIPLRISAKLYEQLAAWAQDEFRSINGQIEFLLFEALRKRMRGDKPPLPAQREADEAAE